MQKFVYLFSTPVQIKSDLHFSNKIFEKILKIFFLIQFLFLLL